MEDLKAAERSIMSDKWLVLSGAMAVLLALGVPAQAQTYIAGAQPDRRPEGAPVITKFQAPKGWPKSGLRGVSDPVPPSLRFIDDQGGWYTPFTRPGMTGRFDIRKLHSHGGAG